MSKVARIILTILAVCMLVFAYWFNYINTSHVAIPRKVDDKIAELEIQEKREPPPEVSKERDSGKKEVDEKDLISTASRLNSSSRQPIRLEGKRNYVTGKNVTFMVPDTMRRLKLSIQEKNGRKISSYNLPNTFISIRPGQRINLIVME